MSAVPKPIDSYFCEQVWKTLHSDRGLVMGVNSSSLHYRNTSISAQVFEIVNSTHVNIRSVIPIVREMAGDRHVSP